MELWCGVENKLGGSFYSRSEAVAVNGITPAMITARQRTVRWIRELGITTMVHWSHLDTNLGWIRPAPRFRRNGASRARRRQRARPVLARPRRWCRSTHRGGEGHAETHGGLGGVGRCCSAEMAPVGRHGWLYHRGRRRRKRDTLPLTPAPGQATLRCT